MLLFAVLDSRLSTAASIFDSDFGSPNSFTVTFKREETRLVVLTALTVCCVSPDVSVVLI